MGGECCAVTNRNLQEISLRVPLADAVASCLAPAFLTAIAASPDSSLDDISLTALSKIERSVVAYKLKFYRHLLAVLRQITTLDAFMKDDP